jgi:hypothetical protein
MATLESTSRRFAWLKKILKQYDDEHSSIFPPEWAVSESLSEKFCVDTKQGITEILLRSENENNFDVKVLIKTLKETIAFESQLCKKYNMGENGKFYRVISTCFGPYLTYYIEAEDKQLQELVLSFRNTTNSKESLAELKSSTDEQVLPSSVELFVSYKESLTHCNSITSKKPLLDLSKVFGKYLQMYAEFLTAIIPTTFEESDVRLICLILNTCDYCSTTILQLEEKIKEKIDEEYKESVTFSAENDSMIRYY